jgi:hypothetical protein
VAGEHHFEHRYRQYQLYCHPGIGGSAEISGIQARTLRNGRYAFAEPKRLRDDTAKLVLAAGGVFLRATAGALPRVHIAEVSQRNSQCRYARRLCPYDARANACQCHSR